jgi:hypothetical protein
MPKTRFHWTLYGTKEGRRITQMSDLWKVPGELPRTLVLGTWVNKPRRAVCLIAILPLVAH